MPLRHRRALWTCTFVSLVAFSAFEITFPLFGHDRLGFTLSSTGAVFAAIGLVLAAVQASLVHPVGLLSPCPLKNP